MLQYSIFKILEVNRKTCSLDAQRWLIKQSVKILILNHDAWLNKTMNITMLLCKSSLKKYMFGLTHPLILPHCQIDRPFQANLALIRIEFGVPSVDVQGIKIVELHLLIYSLIDWNPMQMVQPYPPEHSSTHNFIDMFPFEIKMRQPAQVMSQTLFALLLRVSRCSPGDEV